jgi:ribosomal protein S12 methylthiotransferase RimO
MPARADETSDAATDTSESVAIITMGCARNEVDSEELAARLSNAGWSIVDEGDSPTAIIVNTCGFVDVAKKDSIDAVLAASDSGHGAKVVAVGCLSERYGRELAEALPEADAILGFDDYPQIDERLRAVVAGEQLPAHEPADRRRLLPIAPVDRSRDRGYIPGHADAEESAPGWQPPVLRRRLDSSPVAPLKLASGCDRRCTFCAIPSFRGSFVSRPPAEVLAEAAWLAASGVREVVLVSENSTSYGKDLGDVRMLESLLPALARTEGIERIRVAYLQPAEVRPSLLDVMAATPGVAAYFDLSFQHASPAVLRRMRRFGGTDAFLELIGRIRSLSPQSGIRSNVIVGFPGESQADVDELAAFLQAAELDAIGVFGYSDEEGTEAAELDDKVDEDVIRERLARITSLAEEVMAQRAEDRIGESVTVIVEAIEQDEAGGSVAIGHAGNQGPDDGTTVIEGSTAVVGDVVHCEVVDTVGVDMTARPL